MKVTHYNVLKGKDIIDLQQQVTGALSLGWEPLGGVFVVPSGLRIEYGQALVFKAVPEVKTEATEPEVKMAISTRDLKQRCGELLERDITGVSDMKHHRVLADTYLEQIPFRHRLQMAINTTYKEAMEFVVREIKRSGVDDKTQKRQKDVIAYIQFVHDDPKIQRRYQPTWLSQTEDGEFKGVAHHSSARMYYVDRAEEILDELNNDPEGTFVKIDLSRHGIETQALSGKWKIVKYQEIE